MTGDLNGISQAIGSLQADMKEGIRQRERMDGKLDEISKTLRQLTGLADDVAEMKPAVEDWKRTKQRSIGYLAGAGIAGAGASHGLPWILKKLGIM